MLNGRALAPAAAVSLAGHAAAVVLLTGLNAPPPPPVAPLVMDLALAPVSVAPPQPVPAQKPAAETAPPPEPAVARAPAPPAKPSRPVPSAPPRQAPPTPAVSAAGPTPPPAPSPAAFTPAVTSPPAVASADTIEPPRYTPGSAWCPKPDYPPRARLRGQEGSVTLSVTVGRDGAVDGLSVAASSGHALLDAAAVRAVRGWRFHPATHRGVPVAATRTVVVHFSLRQG